MARFREAVVAGRPEEPVWPSEPATPTSTEGSNAAAQWQDRRLGEILARRLDLPQCDLERIATTALAHRLRFGDAAVALGLASPQDVFMALASQFRYACASEATGAGQAEQLMLRQPRSAQAEAVRALRSELSRQHFRDGSAGAALAVVSPQGQDGRSFLCANLAVAWAQAGRRTLLIDADLRSPRQHQVFGTTQARGLSSLLAGRSGLDAIARVADVPGLCLLPAGPLPPNPLELVDGPVFRDLMGELAGRFDQIVVDTPAAAWGSDALAIADRCAAAVVVARHDVSRLSELAALTQRLGQGSARLAGLVVNAH